jgi:hypothetical protein
MSQDLEPGQMHAFNFGAVYRPLGSATHLQVQPQQTTATKWCPEPGFCLRCLYRFDMDCACLICHPIHLLPRIFSWVLIVHLFSRWEDITGGQVVETWSGFYFDL